MTGTFYCEGLTDFVGSESKSSQHHTNFQILIERKARIKNYATKKEKTLYHDPKLIQSIGSFQNSPLLLKHYQKVVASTQLERYVFVNSPGKGLKFKKKNDLKTTTKITPLKTNMSPENQCLEDVFPTELVPFLGTC